MPVRPDGRFGDARWGRRILVFLTLTAALSAGWDALIVGTGTIEAAGYRYNTGLMWAPGVAALLTCRLTGLDVRAFGWGWGRTRDHVLSYAVPFGYALLAAAVMWVAGFGGVPDPATVQKWAASFGWHGAPDGPASAAAVILWQVLLTGTVGVVRGAANTLGEEIGWRGFLVPALAARWSYGRVSLASGVLWALWHYPILLLADYNAGTPVWYGLTCFTVMTVALSFLYAWLRLRSGSLWTGVVVHTVHNMMIQNIWTPLTLAGPRTPYWADEFGAALALVSLGVATACWWRRDCLSTRMPDVPGATAGTARVGSAAPATTGAVA